MRFPNLVWAIALWGPHYRLAAELSRNESWLSRRLNGRVEFDSDERQTIASVLGYPADWLFQIPVPPPKNFIDIAEKSSDETVWYVPRRRTEGL
jgi:hypothetical protein